MPGFFTPHCAVCGKPLGKRAHWPIRGATPSVCPQCRELIELREHSPEFRQGIEFTRVRKKEGGCSLVLTIFVFLATLCFVVSLLSILLAPRPRPAATAGPSPSPPAKPPEPQAGPAGPAELSPPVAIKAVPIPQPPPPLIGLPYRILRLEETGSSRLSLAVEVPLIEGRLPTQQELETLSTRLAKARKPHDRTFIVFYLPGMILGAGGFATGHHDPQMAVKFELSNLRSYPQYHRFLPFSAAPSIFPTEKRKWRTADGSQLIGRVIDLDVNARTVTLVREDGQRLENFSLDRLHPDDQALILRLRR